MPNSGLKWGAFLAMVKSVSSQGQLVCNTGVSEGPYEDYSV